MSAANTKPGMFTDLQVSIYRTSGEGFEFGISHLVGEVNLFEDINFGFVSGSVVVHDENNTLDIMHLSGDEVITIGASIDGNDIFLVFDITSLNYRSTQGEHKEVYVLNFESFNSRKSASTKISKAYMDKFPEAIVQDVLEVQTESVLDYEAHESNATLSCIIPLWSPEKTIRWLAQNTVSKDRPEVADFTYYETLDGTGHFKSIGSLMAEDPVWSYVKYNSEPKTLQDATFNIEVLQYPDYSFDTIDNQQNGYYASKLLWFDFRTKTRSTEVFNHRDAWDKEFHTEENAPYYDVDMDYDDTKKTDKPNSKVSLYSGASNNFKANQQRNWDVVNTAQYRDSIFTSLNNNTVKLVIPGNLAMHVGHIVDVIIPTSAIARLESGKNLKDTYSSGKYLITTIRHTFGEDSVKTIVGAVKDGSAITL